MSGDRLFPLTPEQRPAVDPAEVVWLSASAGTGKTQVLSARVLRLLLQNEVSPSQILCLTFTKAGAAEMRVPDGPPVGGTNRRRRTSTEPTGLSSVPRYPRKAPAVAPA